MEDEDEEGDVPLIGLCRALSNMEAVLDRRPVVVRDSDVRQIHGAFKSCAFPCSPRMAKRWHQLQQLVNRATSMAEQEQWELNRALACLTEASWVALEVTLRDAAVIRSGDADSLAHFDVRAAFLRHGQRESPK